jgi:O-antigen/teichoic acid export membrane protein
LLNTFFGPLLNVARDISLQLSTGVAGFSQNIRIALNPAIYKTYASDKEDLSDNTKLLYSTMKVTFIIVACISVPIIMEIETILKIWLNNTPKYADIFSRLFLLCIIVDSFSSPLITIIQASGEIKNYQIINSIVLLSIVPLTYFAFSNKFPPQSWLYIYLFLSVILFIIRAKFASDILKIKIYDIFSNIIPVFIVITLMISLEYIVITSLIVQGLLRVFISLFVSVISIIIIGYFIGLTSAQREFFKRKIL